MKFLLLVSLLATASIVCYTQPVQTSQTAAIDPVTSMSTDVAKISRSVNTLAAAFKTFVEKFDKGAALALTAKQQRLILAMDLLSKAEARVAVLQKAQIDLTEKLNETRAKLAQNDLDARPQSIDRSVSFAGTTQTQEIRDNRAAKLAAERATLTTLAQQIQSNLNETNEGLRDAQNLVIRLRREFLPQIEKELFDQVAQ